MLLSRSNDPWNFTSISFDIKSSFIWKFIDQYHYITQIKKNILIKEQRKQSISFLAYI